MRIPIIEALRRIYNDLNNKKLDKLTAGTGIEIIDNTISNTLTSAGWGNIFGNISDQIDLKLEFDTTVTTQSVETVSDVTLEMSVNIPILDKSSDISTNSFAIDPNKMYYFGERTTLTITFNTPTNNNIINEYMFLFTSGSTATTLNVPSSVKWIKDPDIQTNKKYGVSILDNLGVIGEWSNE